MVFIKTGQFASGFENPESNTVVVGILFFFFFKLNLTFYKDGEIIEHDRVGLFG
jgi:hypothetical protein